MALTYRQIVSQIRGSLKLLSSDILLSDRLVLQEVRNATNLIVLQQLDKRKLLTSPNIFTPILCLELRQAPITECCEYSSERKIAKSIKKLPKIGEGTWGLAIQLVTGIDNMKRFKETTPTRYANLLKMNLTNTSDVYYWILNDHIYISNPDTEALNLFAFFTEDIPNDILYPGKDCPCIDGPNNDDLCKNPLDKPFWGPINRLKDIEDIVIQRLSTTFLRLKEDSQSNNRED